MMSLLSFGAPLMLMALAVLPVIWFLLRVTPPKPQREPFPPLKILMPLVAKEKTAQKTPWWLVLLRLLMAGLIITALAQPVLNPRPILDPGQTALVVMIDNGFAATADWQSHVETARQFIMEAGNRQMPVTLIATAESGNDDIRTSNAAEAMEILAALRPRPLGVDRQAAISRLEKIDADYQLVYLTDGLATREDVAAFSRLAQIETPPIIWYQGVIEGLVGLNVMENRPQSLHIEGIRALSQTSAQYNVAAYDARGRHLGEIEMVFAAGEQQAQASLILPLEMRNDILLLQLEDVANAVATRLASSSDKRRRIAFLGGGVTDRTQPLLSPLYYPMQALAPFGDLVRPNPAATGHPIDSLLEANPALLVMADAVPMPADRLRRLHQWLEAGGTLLRFAGPRLAVGEGDDGLLPVRLRRGERTLGGAMSWAQPQKIAAISRQSPLFDLAVPDDVTVSRQILAEPEVQLLDKSWVALEDGTPLVTAAPRGQGRIILIHTTAMPDWSNLALSGFFVEMMQRFVLTSNQPMQTGENGNAASNASRLLAPWRILSATGDLQPPPGFVLPLDATKMERLQPDFYHPPGLYGHEEEGRVALNLLQADARLEPLIPPQDIAIIQKKYANKDNLPLDGFLWAIAVIFFTVDCLVMTLKGGRNHPSLMRRLQRSKIFSGSAAMIAVLTILAFFIPSSKLQAEEGEAQLFVERAAKTHLAYVKTGNRDLDALSQSGLEALSQFINARTTIELGEVVPIDLAQDELGFYPLLYWPVDAEAEPVSPQALAHLGAYMRLGGTVLFDTRDQLESGLDLEGAATANKAHLRRLLADLDIPPLEPAPIDHVVARSFYIMPDFPGRYRGSPLWLEALPSQTRQDENAGWLDYPPIPDLVSPIVRSGDGVSPILITANDFIGAWAQTANDDWFYPTVPNEPLQRLWAFRGGLNIIMYLLSGNYKADQVHAPELLRRLGE